MKISDETKEFLKRCKSELQKNDFEAVFRESRNEPDIALEILLLFINETSVDPFYYMSRVPDRAFLNASRTKLPQITIDGRVTTIGVSAFANIPSLKKVTIGDDVETIDKSAFSACKNLTSLHLGESVRVIKDRAFAETGLKYVYLPESVIVLGQHVFPEDCYLISPRRKKKSLKFPKSELAWYREHLVLDPKLSMVNTESGEESVGEGI